MEEALCHVGDWIRWATSQFTEAALHFGHGTDNAWDEAVQLVFQILYLPLVGVSPEVSSHVFDAVVLDYERKRLFTAIEQRVIERKPLPYITHCAWCAGLPFYVDERVLIPRSPFAECIQKQFSPWLDEAAVFSVQHILEIGTGSGCLAIAAALAFPYAAVDAVDIDEQALAVARVNVIRHHVESQVTLIQSDCFSLLGGKKYHIIFSNPPYVGAEEMRTLPPEYLHEPRGALFAEEEGLAIVVKLLREAVHYLYPHGILLIETGYSAALLQERFPHVAFMWLEQEHGGQGILLMTREQLQSIGDQYGWQ